MTALVLKPRTAQPVQARNLLMHLTRLGRAIDTLVSGLAARKVSEWQMREVQCEIARYRKSVGSNAKRS